MNMLSWQALVALPALVLLTVQVGKQKSQQRCFLLHTVSSNQPPLSLPMKAENPGVSKMNHPNNNHNNNNNKNHNNTNMKI